LKDKPKSTIEKEDSDDEVAEASDKSSDAAEFSDGEYIPAKKSVANDSESEDDVGRGPILAVKDNRSGKVK
jgi:hypothetical protein